MTLATEKEYEHIGETRGCPDRARDLIHELAKRLDALWRYDQYIANAEGRAFLQEFWSTLKQQERENIRQLRDLVAEEVQKQWP